MKKVRELSILCDVEAGAIVFNGPSDPQPEVWPDHEGVQQVIERCQAKQNNLNGEESIQKRINKGKELLMRRREENHREEISQLMILCMAGKTMPSQKDWPDMKMLAEQTLKNINWTEQESAKENENLTDQHLQHGMDIGNMEGYMGIDACEMPQPPSKIANYLYVPSFYNPFSP
ncbi:MADS-box transcription factor PHERES 2-like [Neltuma alba]|uniref:MADS-box transcription factor PHERES 2-like n=1 Tax=Neltuma alba TaxID=207710 RepID=UPI0010A56471|nr:MADS-box transcription factor PHERES 2-like [Prosopis alba]